MINAQNASTHETPRLRWAELILLILAGGVSTAGFYLLTLVNHGSVMLRDLHPILLLVGAVGVAHVTLTWRYGRRGDPVLLPAATLLTGIGLVLSYRLAPALADRQTNSVLLGVATMTAVAAVPWPMRWLRRYRYSWAALGLLLVGLTLIFGKRPTGAGPRLWLGIDGWLFQPSELLKVLLAIFLASYLAEYRELVAFARLRLGPLCLPPLPYLGPMLVVWGLSMLLLVWQRDLGAALLFFGIFLGMLYIASDRLSYVVMGFGLFAAGVLFVVRTYPHVQERVAIWLNPWPQAAEGSYQVVQALIALASGGVLGTGLGFGFPTYIPAVHTDFVFAAVAEEMGLAGAAALIGLYALFTYRGLRIALLADDPFSKLLAAGLTTILSLQTLVILAGNLRLIPLTGVTLPFVSYGGSSLLTSYLILGLLLRISNLQSPIPSLQLPIPNPKSEMGRPTVRLASLLFLAFLAAAVALFYWGWVRAAALTARADNPRHVEAERRWDRGRILDRNGTVVARTVLDERGLAHRQYPYPQLAPVLGYWSLRHGTAGIEKAFDEALHGRPLSLQDELAHRLYHRPFVGHDVVLTIDLELQRVADEALGDVRGAAVLLEARSGAILALASHPTFDPGRIDEMFGLLKEDPRTPLLNRATQGRYPPGSTFKTVTLAAALEEGIAHPGQMFDDGAETLYVEGFPIRCDNNPRGVNRFDLAHAYAYSCNLTFARLGLELGSKRFKEYAARFRIGREIPLEVPVATSQLANDPLLMPPVLLASTAFGQGELLMTPLHMALIAATIANDGVMPRPHLVQRVQTRDGDVLQTTPPEILGVAVTEATARRVRDIMIVSVRDGYARRAQIDGAVVGGKTGTAQLGGEDVEPHAWFIGFAQPADAPDAPVYAVAVIVENGGEGSLVATPIARRILAAAVERWRRNQPEAPGLP